MPRRRRKASGRCPPLEFLESPLNILHGRPSPVFGADNPTTADVVPINEHNSTWVSPQFRGANPDDRRPRRLRRRKSGTEGMTTRARQSSGSRTPSKEARHKYKPLHFRHEETIHSASSTAEDIDPEDCENERFRRPSTASRKSSTSSSNKSRSSSNNTNTPLAERSNGLDSLLDTNKIVKKQAERARALGALAAGLDEESPLETTALRPISNRKDKRPTRQLFSGEGGGEVKTRPRGRNAKGRPGRINFGNPGTPDCNNQDPSPTDLRKNPAGSPHNEPDFTIPFNNQDASPTELRKNPAGSPHNEPDFTIPFQADLSVRTPTGCEQAPVFPESPSCDDDEQPAPSPVFTPVNQRITRLKMKSLIAQGSPDRRSFGPVLVYDTPEEDYGLTAAQRLRKYKRIRISRSKTKRST